MKNTFRKILSFGMIVVVSAIIITSVAGVTGHISAAYIPPGMKTAPPFDPSKPQPIRTPPPSNSTPDPNEEYAAAEELPFLSKSDSVDISEYAVHVFAKNTSVIFEFGNIDTAVKYTYSITNLKTKKIVKNVVAKGNLGNLPKNKNGNAASYCVLVKGYDSKNKLVGSWTSYFHVEKAVVNPKGRMEIGMFVYQSSPIGFYKQGKYIKNDPNAVTTYP